jgi:hypothetical protein
MRDTTEPGCGRRCSSGKRGSIGIELSLLRTGGRETGDAFRQRRNRRQAEGPSASATKVCGRSPRYPSHARPAACEEMPTAVPVLTDPLRYRTWRAKPPNLAGIVHTNANASLVRLMSLRQDILIDTVANLPLRSKRTAVPSLISLRQSRSPASSRARGSLPACRATAASST